jgi:N-acetylmuramoyl-L-alanine amidase
MIRRWALERLSRFFLIATGIVLLGLLCAVVTLVRRPPEVLAVFRFVSTLVPVSPFTPTPEPPPVALVAGHSGGIDPGALCPDGLREVDITTDVAQRARVLLEGRGYRVQILTEFDPRLSATKRDYSPRAFLAIHADSCVNYASGYKVARAANSAIPQEDDRLVRCVSSAYAAATQLSFHAGSITSDMTHYHGLDEINPLSPGAIIELGFLGSDHNILKNHRNLLAQGIADGLDGFLRGSVCQ